MTIVYVTATLPFGAAEPFIIPEIRALQRLDVQVIIVPVRPQGQVVHRDAEPLLATTHREALLSTSVIRGALASVRRSPGSTTGALVHALAARKPATALKNLAVYPKGLWLSRLVEALEADHIHAHWASTTATMAMIASEVSGVSWSFTAHRWDIAENNLLRTKAHSACFVRAISADGLADLRAEIGLLGSKAQVIHMGVEVGATSHAAPRGRSSSGGGVRILVPAGLVPVKGHAFLIGALKILRDDGRDVHADFAGDGPLLTELSQMVSRVGLTDSVRFLGQLDHADLLDRLGRETWDLVAVPSVAVAGEKEGIPVAMLEAMDRCVPVLGTTSGGVAELLGDGAGVLVDPGDSALLARAIEQLMDDVDLRERVARAGQARVRERFSAVEIARELARRFERCAGG